MSVSQSTNTERSPTTHRHGSRPWRREGRAHTCSVPIQRVGNNKSVGSELLLLRGSLTVWAGAGSFHWLSCSLLFPTVPVCHHKGLVSGQHPIWGQPVPQAFDLLPGSERGWANLTPSWKCATLSGLGSHCGPCVRDKKAGRESHGREMWRYLREMEKNRDTERGTGTHRNRHRKTDKRGGPPVRLPPGGSALSQPP